MVEKRELLSNFAIISLSIIFLMLFTNFIIYAKDPDDKNTMTGFSINYPKASTWQKNGTDLTPILYEQINQQCISDGSGGMYIIWEDSIIMGDRDIYMQRIDPDGNTAWVDNGIPISNKIHDEQDFDITCDMSGNAIVVWRDHNGVDPVNIKAQKIDQNGNFLWGPDGIEVCNATGMQIDPVVTIDKIGGIIVAWEDMRNGYGNNSIYAQKLDSDGNPKWETNGTLISNASYTFRTISICTTYDQYVCVAWVDQVTGIDEKLYAQLLNRFGLPEWSVNGSLICNSTGTIKSFNMIYDGDDGVFFTWTDERNGNYDTYIQRIYESEKLSWDENGIALESLESDSLGPRLIRNNGGFIVAWHDDRDGNTDVYGQYITSSGQFIWNSNGSAISNGYYPETLGSIITEGEFILALIKTQFDSYNIFSIQKLDINGNQLWGKNGSIFINSETGKNIGYFVANSTYGYHVVWSEWVIGLGTDVFYHYFDDIPTVSTTGDIQTDVFGNEVIEWTIHDNYPAGYYRIMRNDSESNIDVFRNWEEYTIDTIISVEIDRSLPGIYDYYILFYEDEKGIYGVDNHILVEVIDHKPICYHQENLSCYVGFASMIHWRITDDFGVGEYRVLINDTESTFSTIVDWTPWTNNTFILTPIDSSILGDFNYTIEYNSSLGQFAMESILVSIISVPDESGAPSDSDPVSTEIWQEVLIFILVGFAVVLTSAIIIHQFLYRKEILKLKETIIQIKSSSRAKSPKKKSSRKKSKTISKNKK